MLLLEGLFFTAILVLVVYNLNTYLLMGLFVAHRRRRRCSKAGAEPTSTASLDWPRVTVQLPVYNEPSVAERLIDTVVRLDYPRDRLDIQFLDDSNDETTALAARRIDQYRQQRFNIELIRRSERTGYKAGNLRNGLIRALGDYIVMFDADFLPEPDFLKQTIPHMVADPQLGFVQARWGHLNRGESALTAAQAVMLDGQFVIEHVARSQHRLFINFNGTAGIWRLDCIEAAGNWQYDTLFEDFDLSYRAQLAGWRAAYLPDVVADAELPETLDAFKKQQTRWVKGNLQCLKKLGPAILAAPLPWAVKLQGLIHVSKHLPYPALLLTALLTPLLMATSRLAQYRSLLALLPLVTLGLPALYLFAQLALKETRRGSTLGAWLAFLIVDSGMAWNNTKAALHGLFGNDVVFVRTPKSSGAGASVRPATGGALTASDLAEWALASYFALGLALALWMGQYAAVLPLLLFTLGFGSMAAHSFSNLVTTLSRRLRQAERSA